MIKIIDNFLDHWLFDRLTSVPGDAFKKITAGGKDFFAVAGDSAIDDAILDGVGGGEVVFSFMRVSTDKLDTKWRIHNDGIINGQKPDRAAVLYVSPPGLDEVNGTALWEHPDLGHSFDGDEAQFDRLLEEDAADPSKWILSSIIGYKQNRLVSYPANYFHSKFPAAGWPEGRVVYVLFYKEETDND